MLKKILQAIVFIGTIGLVRIRINKKDGTKFSFDLLSTSSNKTDLTVYHIPDGDDDPDNDVFIVIESDGPNTEDVPEGAICLGSLIYAGDTIGFAPDALLRKNLIGHVSPAS